MLPSGPRTSLSPLDLPQRCQYAVYDPHTFLCCISNSYIHVSSWLREQDLDPVHLWTLLLSSVIHVADSQRIFSKGIHEYLFSNPNASHLHSNPQSSQSIQIGKKVVKLSLVTVMVVYVENPMEYKNKTTRKILEFCMVTGHSQ